MVSGAVVALVAKSVEEKPLETVGQAMDSYILQSLALVIGSFAGSYRLSAQ